VATTVRELLVKLGVKADDRAVQRFDQALKAVRTGMFAAAAGAIALTTAVAGAVAGTARQGDEAAKAAKRIGTTAVEMQELGFAAEQSGARMVDMEVALRRQAVSARDAAKGTGLAAESYAKMGISVTDANGQLKPQLQLLEEAADGIATLTTETDRLAVVNDIFGRGGAKILPLLKEGAEGIRKYREQARELGFVLDEEATEASENFIDRLNELRKIITGLRNRIGLAFMPVLTRMIERFRDWFVANRRLIDQRLDKIVIRITDAIDIMKVAWEEVDEAVQRAGGWEVIIQQVKKALVTAGIASAIRLIVPAVLAVNAAFALLLANPVILFLGLLGLALIATGLLVEDFTVFLRGGDSAIGDYLESIGRAEPVLEKFERLTLAAKNAVKALSETIIGPFIEALAEAVPEIVSWDNAMDLVINKPLLRFVQDLENGMTALAIAFERITKALTDPGGLGADFFRELGGFQENVSKVFEQAEAATTARGGAFGGGFAGGVVSRAQQFSAAQFATAAGISADIAGRFGPQPAMAAVGGGVTTVTVEGNQITIPTTASAEATAEAIAREDRKQRTAAAAAIRGGDR
jgi:Ca2+/Na+ antiporter